MLVASNRLKAHERTKEYGSWYDRRVRKEVMDIVWASNTIPTPVKHKLTLQARQMLNDPLVMSEVFDTLEEWGVFNVEASQRALAGDRKTNINKELIDRSNVDTLRLQPDLTVTLSTRVPDKILIGSEKYPCQLPETCNLSEIDILSWEPLDEEGVEIAGGGGDTSFLKDPPGGVPKYKYERDKTPRNPKKPREQQFKGHSSPHEYKEPILTKKDMEQMLKKAQTLREIIVFQEAPEESRVLTTADLRAYVRLWGLSPKHLAGLLGTTLTYSKTLLRQIDRPLSRPMTARAAEFLWKPPWEAPEPKVERGDRNHKQKRNPVVKANELEFITPEKQMESKDTKRGIGDTKT